MERVLGIEEILRQIFDKLLPDFDMKESFVDFPRQTPGPSVIPDKDTRATLLNLVLTCRSFVEPALDTLWWAMDDLKPLFSLMPGFQEVTDLVTLDTHTISGPVHKSDCLRFDAYARRIKFYYLTEAHSISTSTYFQVSHTVGRSFLLPSLHYLCCNISTPQILFLLSPCLRAFWGTPALDDRRPLDIHAFLDLLDQSAPSLVGLGLSISLNQRCLSAVGRIRQLKYLSLEHTAAHSTELLPISIGFFTTFSSSSTLSHLYFGGSLDFLAPGLPGSKFCFSALSAIKIDAESETSIIPKITNIFRIGTFPQLREFKMGSLVLNPGMSEVDYFPDFFRYIGQTTNNSLNNLFLDECDDSGVSTTRTTVSELPELLNLSLTRFRMGCLGKVSLADIKLIVKSWPKLQYLSLSSSLSPKPEFSALLDIAAGLPRLFQLEIEQDCREIPGVEEIPVLSHPLRYLLITGVTTPRESRLKDSVNFARCIDKVFPKLFLGSCKFEPPDSVVWKQVGTILLALQGARKDEWSRDASDSESESGF